jgi:hypothetical protein
LNDRTAIGEKGNRVRRALEPQEEFIGADGAVKGKAGVHGGEIDLAAMFVDLHGVTAAESNVWTAFAGKMREAAGTAYGTLRVRAGRRDFGTVVGPQVIGEERTAHKT